MAPAKQSAQAWSGRFSEPVAELVKRYTASVAFDQRLAASTSRARSPTRACWHAQGIISRRDLAAIERGMTTHPKPRSSAGRFDWSIDLEDVHLNIERRLTELDRRRRQAAAHRRARATTRSPPTSACGCATRSTRSSPSSPRLQTGAAGAGRARSRHASCPASPTCRSRSR